METLDEFFNSGATKDENFTSINEEIGKLKELDKTFTGIELSKNMVNKEFKQIKKKYHLAAEILVELTAKRD